MNKPALQNYRRNAMLRINQFLSSTGLTGYLGKQNVRIRKFAELNNLQIPQGKKCIQWAIELYLSKENKNCSQDVKVERHEIKKRYPIKAKTERKASDRFDDELIECARIIDAALDSKESKYIKLDYAKAYLLSYCGYFEEDLEKLQMYVHTDDIKGFIDTTSVVHWKYLKSLKWAQMKDFVREKDNYICCQCGADMSNDLYHLHTHHLTYARLGNENPESDLVLLCSKCHTEEHKKK